MHLVSTPALSLWRLVLAAVIFVACSFSVAAEEVIRFYSVNLTLLENSSVDVTEVIEVRAEGGKIKRGIFRDIPTTLNNDDGSTLHSGLEILEVLRGGDPEPWFRRKIGDYSRIYIGDEEVFLSSGIYRYTIHYTMTRMARRFDDYDEIFWNAIGTYWDFPIQSAVATINLPEGAVADDIAGYTGTFGDTQSDVTITRNSDTQIVFRATRPFSPYEGMSVAVSFQKGILSEPGDYENATNYISDHRDTIVPGLSVLLVLLFYLFTWRAVGRDPEKGTIIPLFHAPTGFSPALVHYIHNMGWKGNAWNAFSAAMINLAVKGLISIEKVGKRTKLAVTDQRHYNQLPSGEAIIYGYLSGKGSVTINKSSGPSLKTKRSEFVSAIETESRQSYFKNNYRYVVAGVALSIACIAVLLLSGVLAVEWLLAGIFIGGFLAVIVTVSRQIWMRNGIGRYFQFALLGFFLVNFVGGFGVRFGGIFDLGFEINTPAIAAATIIAVNVLFAVLMRAPTLHGQKIMDQISGFRMYLDTAEKERLNLIGEPKMTTKRFEAILPYAIALGVEKPWSEHFEGELSRNAVVDAAPGYSPHWYHGSNLSRSSIGADMAALGTGMSAAMVAAQPVSSSSSGSSGGGSSGGGGGGGGGGGW